MGIDIRWMRYGRPAAEELRASISLAKGDEPLAPVTIVVPSNYVGVATRRHLASGRNRSRPPPWRDTAGP